MTITAESNDQSTSSSEDNYFDQLRILSEASVHKRFDPYLDIDWDSPAFALDVADRRWILPESDIVGRHPWYRALPEGRQIDIGRWRIANIYKVGLQFESILIRGITQYSFTVPNGSPEFRYCVHEAAEECNHTMMFQEMINRIGLDVPGVSWWMRGLSPLIPLVAGLSPTIFFIGILAGEEPIDHTQKSMLRDRRADIHPLALRVMEIHVAEEARHISFAHQFIERRVTRMNPLGQLVMSVAFPIAMRWLVGEIMVPPSEFRKKFDIPQSVIDDMFWDGPESQEVRRNMFADVRMLAHKAGAMNPLGRLVWKICGIDGDTSRFRSEPARTHTA
ncbi:AurF N-oxygenase family protein [Antrihabitans cavernicola]|uniref:Diiron oxygenase n=1 Tax=Antrihabitans cavernicola TaxID=2495913 RepID=A0A5A7S1X8_9NOCA|nr:diiron oxygenase [Spelaeibacter cavernicola]KAA0017665.1 diiron oxygenase [Spelaeibacter cavernicola]